MSGENISLKERVIRGGGWVISGFVLSQVIRLGGNLILTRLLFPEAFGLIAIVFVLMTGLALFSDLGINQSIIKSCRGDEPDFLNTAWVFQIFRGVLIWMLILSFAYAMPQIVKIGWLSSESVYADPLLSSILVVYSFAALIQGFESTKLGLAQRKLNLKGITQVELSSQVIALIVMIVWAWLSRSIWALVGGALVAATVRCVMSHLWLPGPVNRFKWNSDCFNEIFHFGKWIFLLSILGFLWMNGDRIVLGGLIGSAQLGVYSIAYMLSSSVVSMYSSILSRVLFPAFSEVIQNRPENLASVYQRLQTISDFTLFGVAGFLYVSGQGVVSLLYDDRYADAGNMLSILALGLIGVRYATVEYLCMAKGHMSYLIASNFIRLIALYTGLIMGYHMYGMEGALFGISLSFFAAWPISLYYKYKKNLMNWRREIAVCLVFPIGASMGWLFLQVLP